MSSYKENIDHSSCKTIYDIIEWCHNRVPSQWKPYPWKHPELNHGIDLLASEEALDCYMSAYGEMHSGKCRAAMMNFPFDKLQGSVEIIDWGCGQGIGSGIIVDVLKQREMLNWVKRITLVEPSRNALYRAECNLTKIVQGNIEINPINKFLPANSVSENILTTIGYRYSHIIHVFSNILDVSSIDLAKVARLVASSHGTHYIMCVGPKNAAAYRIEQFVSVFGEQQYFCRIDSTRFDRAKQTAHPYTCMARCFVYNGATLDLNRIAHISDSNQPVYNDYDLQLQIQNNMLSRQKARVAYRLQNILSIDDVLYIDPIINETSVDFIIIRPNKGALIVNVFEEDLNECSISDEAKEISCGNKKYQSPIDLISSCQTSIKDGIEELLISTIENASNFSLIKKAVIFTENNQKEVRDFFNANNGQSNYTYLYGSEFINDKKVSQTFFGDIKFIYNSPNFDERIKRKLASIISPSWHSYQEGRTGLEPKGPQKRLVRSANMQQKISGRCRIW